jgi:hypothetical protein
VRFTNSGTEGVETAIKLARCATRRPTVIYCRKAFHGLTTGALSLNGDETFREGFDPFLAEKQAGVSRLIQAYRGRGHRIADIDPLTLTLAPGSVRRAVGVRCSAVLATHTFGTPCDVAAEEAIVLQDRGWTGDPRPCSADCTITETIARMRCQQAA